VALEFFDVGTPDKRFAGDYQGPQPAAGDQVTDRLTAHTPDSGRLGLRNPCGRINSFCHFYYVDNVSITGYAFHVSML
jgi:hypothetical protein